MKKIYLLLAVFFVASVNLMAQTDVTATYLTNAGFDEAPTIFTLAAGGKISNADTDYRITRITGGTGPGWRFTVTGWDETSTINANAVQITTAEYGFTAAPTAYANGLNSTIPPLTQKNGVTATGASLHMSAGWGDKALISKSVNLIVGKYKLFYDAYNAHTNAAIAVNLCGYTNSSTTVTGLLKSIPQNTWKTDSVTFTVLQNLESGTINIGFTTSSSGSGNGAKLYIDNVKLMYYGIDKKELKLLMDSATVMNNNRQDVGSSTAYTDLAAAIANAQVVYNNTGATVIAVVEQETALKTAITNVYGAITLQTRKTTWTTFPYNATSAITNPSFESGFTGWTNTGPFQAQTNTSFDPFKAGTYYAERWIAAPGQLADISLLQTIRFIPNGVYMVTASGHAVQQSDNTYPGGAYLTANADFVNVLERKDYSVTTTVTDNLMSVGFEIFTSGNWVAVDNFRLTYLSDGSPYLLTIPETLSFSPNINQKSINIKGGNLTNDITLSVNPLFTLSKNSITSAEATAEGGVDVLVTYTGTGVIPTDTLVLTSGSVTNKIPLTVSQTLNASVAGLFFDQSLPTSLSFNVTGDVYSNISITAPVGITLSENSVTPAEALSIDGKAIAVQWNASSRVRDAYIYLTAGSKKDSVLIFAVNDNIISTWDGDNAEGEGSKLTNFGWDQTLADGVTPGSVVFNDYNVTGGVRYVPATSAAHTYKGKTWIGHRVAYLRSWGSPATNSFNLAVNLEAGKIYVFRGVAGWHNNETNPTFTYSVNTAKANLGTTLGTQSVLCTVRQRGEDYGYEFTPTTTATHYLTVTSSAVNDAMSGIDYLAIFPKVQSFTGFENTDVSNTVYPTVTKGSVYVNLVDKSGIINVYDVAGKLISSKTANAIIETISLPSAGMYFVEVKSAGYTKTTKVVRVN